MDHGLTGCGCVEDLCATMPPEFVRVRYFYGQRLGVMELNDEAAYHQAKHAFHNARLHGAGVLCGLRAERFVTVPGSVTTVLRVIRGAAIDACGREIVVGVDQCIDVAAWFARNRHRPELASFANGDALHVCVRYRECPTDPSPAPRDPCGCGTGSCEYGRVREGFELSLLTDAERDSIRDVSFPPTAALQDALAAAGGAAALEGQITRLVSADCPTRVEECCLCLASFGVVLSTDPDPAPVDITEPDNAIPARQSLLSTSALQSMAIALAVGSADAGLIGSGPRIGAMRFEDAGADAGTLVLPVHLAPSLAHPDGAPIVEQTFDAATVTVRELAVSGSWDDFSPAPDVDFDEGPPQFTVKVASGLEKDVLYLLDFAPDAASPIVDEAGRPLRPQRLTRLFKFVEDGGVLKLAPSL
jgi:hypothetical protein